MQSRIRRQTQRSMLEARDYLTWHSEASALDTLEGNNTTLHLIQYISPETCILNPKPKQ